MKLTLSLAAILFAFLNACSDSVQGPAGQDSGAVVDAHVSEDVGGPADVSHDAGTQGIDTGAEPDGGFKPDTGVMDDGGIHDVGTPDAGSCAQGVVPKPGLVVTKSGAVQGRDDTGAYVWLGIPYAEPPTGQSRWRAPQLRGCRSGTLQADAYGERCAQVDNAGVFSGSEDCLTLNIWAPAGYAQGTSYPVMVFIHGGGHVQGSSSEKSASGSYVFDAHNLALAAGAVVVTFNYRLGAFGWLTHPAFAAEDPDGASGNYGLRDQIAVLAWIRDNIEGFGGNPGRVMVFGESAGGVDACMLLVSPMAKGLFNAAAMQSGACMARPEAFSKSFGETFAKDAKCGGAPDVAVCLRALTAVEAAAVVTEQLMVAEGWNSFHPSVDGHVIPGRPLLLIGAGDFNRVPIIVGSNADETDLAVDAFMLESDYRDKVLALGGGDQALADRMLAQYPISDYLFISRTAYVKLTSDRKFTCPARRAARAITGGGGQGVWRYFFTHAFKNNPLYTSDGAFHGVELTYLFDHLQTLTYIPSQGEKTIRDRMIRYWGTLAAAGDPNDGYIQKWPPYDHASDPYVKFEDPIEVLQDVRGAKCDFWDSIDAAGDAY